MTHEPMMLPAVRAVLAADRKRWQEISEATEIPISTIKKIRYGESANPGVNTVEKLYVHLVGSVTKGQRKVDHKRESASNAS